MSKTFCRTQNYNANSMEKLIELKTGIWLYKNFLDLDLHDEYLRQVTLMTEDEWDSTHFNFEPGDFYYKFWNSRSSKIMWHFDQLHSKLCTFFAPTYWTAAAHRIWVRMKPLDTPPTVEEAMHINVFNNHFNFFSKWRLGIYMGEFTGGEVVFPDFNNFSVAVGPRDMLVWRSNYQFTVNEVTSGTRYSYSDFLIDPFDHFFA